MDKILSFLFRQLGHARRISGSVSAQQCVHIALIQENVIFCIGSGADAIIQLNHAVFQRTAGRQVGPPIFEL